MFLKGKCLKINLKIFLKLIIFRVLFLGYLWYVLKIVEDLILGILIEVG